MTTSDSNATAAWAAPLRQCAATGMARYVEVDAKSLTGIYGTVDPWLLARYGMNLYRGCEHGCIYCDGRAERYHVTGDFARDITVKRNAVAVLGRQLDRIKEPGFVFLGGGVSDAYQPAEERYRLARGVLGLALARGLPVHVLTKSALVARDLDLLAVINSRTRAILSFSLQTGDEQVRRCFEPGAAPIADRWALLGRAKALGLGAGLMLMPVLPGISDRAGDIDALVGRAAALGLDFVCFGGLTLRPGAQQNGYLAVIGERYPELCAGYRRVYRRQHPSGAGDGRYYTRIEERYRTALAAHGLAGRIPHRLYAGLLPRYAEAAVRLEHREFEQRGAGGGATGLARAGFAIQQWARRELGRRSRRRGFDYRVLERELAGMATDGSLLRLPGMTVEALELVRGYLMDADGDGNRVG
jgi:DNA repair photolyase